MIVLSGCAHLTVLRLLMSWGTSAGELMNERTRRPIEIFRESRLRQTVNVSLYHVTKFPLYLSFTTHSSDFLMTLKNGFGKCSLFVLSASG